MSGPELEFLRSGEEMGERMRAFDWGSTSLGPASSWPQSLQAALSICVGSRFPIALYWGPDLTLLYNSAWSSILGAKHPWALGHSAREVWPEIWDTIGPLFDQVLSQGESTYSEDQLLAMRRHGYTEECYFNYTFTPIRGEDRSVLGVFNAVIETTYRVISERRAGVLRALGEALSGATAAQQACDRAVEVLREASADAPFSAIYLLEEGGQVAHLAGSVGLAPGSPAAPARLALGSPEDASLWSLGREAASPSPRVVAVDERTFGRPPPGGPWPEPSDSALVVPLAGGAGGQALGFVVLGVSPRRAVDEAYRQFAERVGSYLGGALIAARAHEEERRRAAALAEIDRAKTAFFSNVSHEFRTPLTLMLGPVDEMLQAAGAGQPVDREQLALVHRNGLRLLRLVNTLLDFSRIEAGRAQAHVEPTELSVLTADLASTFRAAIEKGGVRLEVDCPPLTGPVFVDHEMWEKIVLNLLSNAFKHTFEGQIAVRLRDLGPGVQLEVSDTGIGIPAHELPHLFERFHRVHGARSRTQEGTGIGLALVHELIRLHQGHIEVASEVGQGTTFRVRLPRGQAARPLDPAAPRDRTALGAAPFVEEASRWLPDSDQPAPPSPSGLDAHLPAALGHPGRVLLADDNADMREYVARLLRPYGQVEAVADGDAALAAARREAPALVISDVMMPGLDGFELLRALRGDERTRSVPVMLLSARAGEEAKVEGLAAGASDYLVKPFSARELVARVTAQLSQARARAVADLVSERIQAIFRQVPVAVSVVSGPGFTFEFANPRYEEMVQRTGLVGKTLREAFPELPDDAPLLHLLRAIRETGEPFSSAEYRVPLERREGHLEDVYFLFSCQPLLDASGQSDALVTVAVDVTEQVQARQRLEDVARREEQARQQAEQASRAKDEFLSTLSHELRTPLNAIVGWAHLLRSGSVTEGQRERALETIERNARAQARLIEDLLDLSRIVQGKLVLSVAPVEMVRVVEAALETMRLAAEAKGVRLQPVLDSHATIVGDADRLQQVVWNLLSNAIKFTPRGGRVQVRLRRLLSYVEVVVADTGQGIEPAFLPHVFDRFRQADGGITRQFGGLGLGLAIARSLVELHGGTIAARSDGPGLGSTFSVRLPTAPLRADAAPDLSPGAEPEGPDQCPPELRGLRILVIDDEPDTRELLAFVLSRCHAHVTLAATAAEALAALQQRPFDVMLSDIGLPGDDGLTLIRRVRQLTSPAGRIPALALTAYARSEDRTAALRAGFQMHLAKPIEPGELLVTIASLATASARPGDPPR